MKRSVLKSLEKMSERLSKNLDTAFYQFSYYNAYGRNAGNAEALADTCNHICTTITEISILMSKLEDDIDPERMRELETIKRQLGEIE